MMKTYNASFQDAKEIGKAAEDLAAIGVEFQYIGEGIIQYECRDEDLAISIFANGKPRHLTRENPAGGPWSNISLDGRGIERDS
ncbi:MAG: hypothetical protein IIA49_10495 [Bacteroidetes bacterium]|nr:hypothetical protein [Bacteroidota bacterium]